MGRTLSFSLVSGNCLRLGLGILLCVTTLLTSPGNAANFSTEAIIDLSQGSTSMGYGEGKSLSSKFSGSWKLDMDARSFQEAEDEFVVTRFGVGLEGNYLFTPNIDFYGKVKAKFSSGRRQGRFNDPYDNSAISPQDFFIRAKAGSIFEIRFGANSQMFLQDPLLVSSYNSFPGFIESFNFGSENLRVKIISQQAIPSSSSMGGDRSEKEALPKFYTNSLFVESKAYDWFQPELSLTHYKFEDLPAIVAFDSSRMGNAVSGELANNSKFVFDFEGTMISAEACICGFDSGQIKFGARFIENQQAPESYNKARTGFLAAQFPVLNMVVAPKWVKFFNESDTVPAYYNSSTFGGNNRQGTELQLVLIFEDYQFQLVSKYISADVINQDPHQERLTSMYIGLETFDVAF